MMRYSLYRFLILPLISALLQYATPVTADSSPTIHGWQEAVLSVRDIDSWVDVLEDVAGWELIHRGASSRAWMGAWDVDSQAVAEEALLANPGSNKGYIRLVSFAGTDQQLIRSNAQTWETGGWFDVNARVLNLDRRFTELQQRGWSGYADPVKLHFGPFTVNEWLARGPDGIVFALIERIEPPLKGWPALRSISRLFNATTIVDDLEASLDFYLNGLGFKVYLEFDGSSQEAGPNVLGLPHNLTDKISRQVRIVHPQGVNDGSIELIKFDGATGRDFSTRARPPNLGILMLRFPVRNIDRLSRDLKERGVTIESQPYRLELPPYGDIRIMSIRGPDGEIIEFFERLVPGTTGESVNALIDLMAGEFRSKPDDGSSDDQFELLVDRRTVIHAPQLGSHVVFWQLNTGEDEQLYRQRLLVFEFVPDRDAIIQTTWSFREPGNFVDAFTDSQRLAAISLDDLERTLPVGCEQTWRPAEQGWAALLKAKDCRIWSERRKSWRLIEAEVKVTAEAYWQAERGFDDAGKQVFGTPPGQLYRLERVSAKKH